MEELTQAMSELFKYIDGEPIKDDKLQQDKDNFAEDNFHALLLNINCDYWSKSKRIWATKEQIVDFINRKLLQNPQEEAIYTTNMLNGFNIVKENRLIFNALRDEINALDNGNYTSRVAIHDYNDNSIICKLYVRANKYYVNK